MQLWLPGGLGVTPPVDPSTWVEQAAGVDGAYLKAKRLETDVGSAVAFHRQRPFFQGINNFGTSLVTSTWTPMVLAEIADNAAGHNDSVNTSRLYFPSTSTGADWYLITGYVPMPSTNTANVHIAGLRIDGTGTNYEGSKLTSGPHTVSPSVIDLLPLSSGHYVELLGWQDTGGTVTTPVSGKTPSLTVRWACAATGTVVAMPGTPRTWTAADAITADAVGGAKVALNVHVRDLVRWLNYPPIARLTSAGTAQTIPNATTWTSIQLPTVTVDNYTGWATGSNTRYTAQRAGLYFIAGQFGMAETGGANTGYRAVRLLHTLAAGGTVSYNGTATVPGTTTVNGTSVIATAHIRMAVGDFVEVQASQTQGAARAVNSSAGNASKLIVVYRSI